MPITLRNADIPLIYKALQALDGRPSPVDVESDDGKKRTMIHTQPYTFSGMARLTVARWIARLKTETESLGKTHDGLVKQYATVEVPDKVEEKRMPEWRAEWMAVQEAAQDYDLALLKYEELKPEDNKLPGSVLGLLMPLLVT